MNSVPQWIINTPFSEQKSCVVTYGPIQTFNHLKRETRERTKKRKNAHQRDVYHRENDSPRPRLTRVCVCVFVRRGRENRLVGWLVSSFFDGSSKTKREEEERRRKKMRRRDENCVDFNNNNSTEHKTLFLCVSSLLLKNSSVLLLRVSRFNTTKLFS